MINLLRFDIFITHLMLFFSPVSIYTVINELLWNNCFNMEIIWSPAVWSLRSVTVVKTSGIICAITRSDVSLKQTSVVCLMMDIIDEFWFCSAVQEQQKGGSGSEWMLSPSRFELKSLEIDPGTCIYVCPTHIKIPIKNYLTL